MTRQVTDQLYIEIDYFTPEEYYVYVAEAQSSQSAEFTQTAVVGKIIEASATLSVEATQTVTAGKILSASVALAAEFNSSTTAFRLRDIDLFAFGDAQIATTVNRLRDINAAVSDQFTINTDYTRILDYASALSSEFAQSAQITRGQAFSTAMSAAFSLAADVSRTRNGSSTQNSEATVSATVIRQQQGQAQLNSEFTQTAQAGTQKQGSSTINSAFSQTAQGLRTRTGSATLAAEFSQTAQGDRTRSSNAGLSSEFTVSSTGFRTKQFASTQSSAASLTASGNLAILGSASLSTAFTQTTVGVHVKGLASAVSVEFQQSAAVNAVRDSESTLASEFTQAAQINYTADVDIATDSIFSELAAVAKNATGTVLMETAATLSATPNKIIQYIPNGLTGVRSTDDNDRYSHISGTGTAFEPGYTIAIWYKKDSTSRTRAPIWASSDGPSGGQQEFRLEYINNSDIRLFMDHSNISPQASGTWVGAMPTDGDPHQYILRHRGYANPNFNYPDGGNIVLELWRDGVNLGTKTIARDYIQPFNVGLRSRVNFAYTLGSPEEPNTQGKGTGDASYYQFWAGTITSFDVNRFYNSGAVDLGDGTAFGQLPTPTHYNRLTSSYTGVTFVNTPVELRAGTEILPLPDLSSRASLTANGIGVFLFNTQASSQFTQTAAINKTARSAASLSAESFQITDSTTFVGTISTLNAQASLTALGGYRKQGQAALNSAFALSASVVNLNDSQAQLVSQFTVAADFDVIPPIRGEANLASAFVVDATIGEVGSVETNLGSEFTVFANADVIPPVRTEANLSSESTLNINFIAVRSSSVQLTTTATTNIVGQRLRRPAAGLASTTTLTSTNFKVVNATATLPVVATQLSVASTLSIDLFYQYLVEQESRQGTVLPENRVFLVESETRVNMIL